LDCHENQNTGTKCVQAFPGSWFRLWCGKRNRLRNASPEFPAESSTRELGPEYVLTVMSFATTLVQIHSASWMPKGRPGRSSSRTQQSTAFLQTWITSMLNNETIMRCRVCGLVQSEPPWGDDGHCPTFDFCPCCGVEFGYGDASPTGVHRWRQKWLASGAKWAEPEEMPTNWSLEEQLRTVS